MKYPTYKLGQICIIERGGSPRPIKNYLTNADDGINWIKIGDATLSNKYIYKTAEKIKPEGLSKTRKVESGDLILSNSMSFGRPYIMRTNGCIHDGWVVFRLNKEIIDEEYLYTILTSNEVYAQFSRLATGSTVKNLNIDRIKEVVIPLPPLTTQHAIVSRIESLFAELDKAEERLRTAQQQLKTYKQAVLKSAFNGDLTAEWRKNNHIDNSTWKVVTFAEIAEIKCNLVDVKDYGDFPHIAPDNIEKESGRLLEYRTVSEDGVISGKHRFFPGQILYSKIRPNLSKVVIANFDGLCSADMYPIEAKENTKFLFYQMLSSKFVDYASNSGSRTVLPKINQKSLSIIPMKICSLSEQQRIVEEIESRLSQASTSSACIEEALQQTEALRQSILKKAFSGELVVSTSSTTTKGA